MKYDDLLNVPFKHMGRDKSGLDCYGAVLECCKRAGTPLLDLFSKIESLPAEEAEKFIKSGLNVKEIPEAKPGAIVYSLYKGCAHVGYIVERGKMLHATWTQGVKISPLAAVKAPKFYEVINDDSGSV